RAGPALLRGRLQPRLAPRGPRGARGCDPRLSPGARAFARLRRRALQPRRGPGAQRSRRGGHQALAALPRARFRQPVGAHRAGSPRGRRSAGAPAMRVLIVGGGGREHALAWKIAQSPMVDAMFAAPGNPGIARHASRVDIAVDAHDDLVSFERRERIDLTVVGPEVPLVAWLAARLTAAGLTVFGPSARAAALEGSKVFSKDLMSRAGVPTARFASFDQPAAARRYCREVGAPLVVKADGLAAGKGAIVCRSLEEADAAIAECMERRAFGLSGARVVVEEFMVGQEVSFFALANGHDAIALAAAQDHKTIFDGDR